MIDKTKTGSHSRHNPNQPRGSSILTNQITSELCDQRGVVVTQPFSMGSSMGHSETRGEL